MNPSLSLSFQPHIHRLRGVAILMIVALHCVSFFSWDRHPLLHKLLRELFDNSTVLFMFISGFLFQHLSRGFQYREYLQKKLRNVLIPYVIVVTPAIVYAISRGDISNHVEELRDASPLYEAAWLSLYPGMLLDYALWFIPVITLYYLAAPLLLAMDRHRLGYLALVPLLAISILGHRPTYGNGHNFQLAAYFLSSYVFGMFLSHFRAKAEPLIARTLPWLACAFLLVFGAHTVLTEHDVSYQVSHLFSFEHGLIDWLFVQKALLAVVLLGMLKLLNRIQLPTLDYVGQISFTIYFVHLYVLFVMRAMFHWRTFEGNLPSWLLVYAVTLAGSCGIAMLAHRLLGRHSRIVVGS